MATKAHQEANFHDHVYERLIEAGWAEGDSSGYDPNTGFYTEDIFAWLEATAKDELEGLKRREGSSVWKDKFISAMVDQMKSKSSGGALRLFRRGFESVSLGTGRLEMSARPPQSAESKTAEMKYAATRYRVVRELAYSAHNKNRLDLALFINGLPVATLELKSYYTQSINDALWQYKNDRQPGRGAKAEPLLQFNRGAFVHFALTQEDVRMTTHLKGGGTYFLPFNRGKDGGAGNDPYPGSYYPAAHLWEDALQPQNLLHILQYLLILEGEGSAQRLIFPRYHQLDVVRKLLETSSKEGAGHTYLIQHSAGSGKSKSIVWTAQGLIRLQYDEDGEVKNLFQSVIIVTDRRVLDKQLKDELANLGLDESLFQLIDTKSGGSKSAGLAKALVDGKRIIVVTMQTFSHVRDELASAPSLAGSNYAVIIDEAHSGTSGETATDLRLTLTGQSEEEFQKLSELEHVGRKQAARALPKNISFYAFTATPKAQTITLFGRPAGDDEAAVPEAFHVYTMKQAIEEGFILDVLQNYVTKQVVMGIDLEDDRYDILVREGKAKREVNRWKNLHDDNIRAKLELVLDHFMDNVVRRDMLRGQAKAMICTGSRAEAVKWHLMLQRMVEAEPLKYGGVASLVAFSTDVSNRDVKDERYPKDHDFNEKNLNPDLHSRDIPTAFDQDLDKQLLIVANKYQTGFDQPKLVAMYVDKTLNDIEAVQTLSRLNRTMKEKEQTFVLDFRNDPEKILKSFQKYYKEARLESAQNLEIILTLRDEIIDFDIFSLSAVDSFINSLDQGRVTDVSLARHIGPARDRFNDGYAQLQIDLRVAERRLEAAQGSGQGRAVTAIKAELDQLQDSLGVYEEFRRNLQSFCRKYRFIAQILQINLPELEGFYIFAEQLMRALDKPPTEKLELSGLVLTTLLVRSGDSLHGVESAPIDEEAIKLRNQSGTARAGRLDEKTRLRELLHQLSEQLGLPIDNIDGFTDGVANDLAKDEQTVRQIRNNSDAQVLGGTVFPNRVEWALNRAQIANHKIVEGYYDDDDITALFRQLLVMKTRERVE